jgi:hypothetical protein
LPKVDLSDDELDALVEALRRLIDEDKFPLAQRNKQPTAKPKNAE